ncbi:TrbG/VirB9 family P-type conjugative transfer protein [Sphingomonas sp.]|uniref:TrbG/VirB9 family P-type conjugative transfer protein n=1 Tax=Sphingomonas sp. TaxID=28214 RepID=UPI0025E26C96|nr:TrbG/VirB9 family P-type conjugative transfer protein [Sphingomonas sp.]MBV9528434.1 TrbG/VirB9 family P-type conjugative transfer protein [Sphingomonas sp.]
MKRGLAFLLLSLTAARRPEPGLVDPHIQSVPYDPDQVTELNGALGWQIMIEFGPDERIENVSIGDALAWQVTPNKKARDLFLKPLIKNAATNMTVVTDRRRYAFELQAGPRSPYTPWVVQFDYPKEVVQAVSEPLPPPPPQLRYTYTIAGDVSVRPSRVWDDGESTYFEFPQDMPFPAIYAGGPKTAESLVNTQVRDRVIIVQQTSGRFTLRSGNQFATVTYAAGAAQ